MAGGVAAALPDDAAQIIDIIDIEDDADFVKTNRKTGTKRGRPPAKGGKAADAHAGDGGGAGAKAAAAAPSAAEVARSYFADSDEEDKGKKKRKRRVATAADVLGEGEGGGKDELGFGCVALLRSATFGSICAGGPSNASVVVGRFEPASASRAGCVSIDLVRSPRVTCTQQHVQRAARGHSSIQGHKEAIFIHAGTSEERQVRR